MLFRQHILEGIAEGRVTLAFRRWRRAPPADGSTLRSPIGVIALERVTVVDEGDITPEDVRRTGMSVGELRASIDGVGTLIRIELRLAGDRLARAGAAGRRRCSAVQAPRAATEGARPDREPRGRLPLVAARPHSAGAVGR